MNRPDLSYINHLHDLFIAKYERYLPTAFSDNLTLLQKVNMVIERMNQIGEITNELVDKWNEINKWLINDGLTEEVNKKINELVKDGTLADMINDELLQGIRFELDQKVDLYDYNKEINNIYDEIDKVTQYPEGVSKEEIIDDVLESLDRRLFSNLENSVIDGDFKGDRFSEHFMSNFGTGTYTENNTVIMTSSGNHSIIGSTISQTLKPNFSGNDKWYIVSRVKSINSGIRDILVGIRGGESGESMSGTGDSGDLNINYYYTISHLFDKSKGSTNNEELDGSFRVSVSPRYNTEHEGKSIEIDYLMAINLSKVFGLGNEPDKEFMDYLISLIPNNYFDGKISSGVLSTTLLKISKEIISDLNMATKTNVNNLLYNSIFDIGSGAFGWTTNGTGWNTNNGKFEMIGNGSTNLIRLNQVTNENYGVGDKIFIKSKFDVKSDETKRIGFAVYGTENVQPQVYEKDIDSLGVNEYYKLITLNEGSSGKVQVQFRVRYDDSESAEGSQVDIYEPLALNLTKIYGKGNEPDLEGINRLVEGLPDKWFEGNLSTNDLLESLLKYTRFQDGKLSELNNSEIKNAIFNTNFKRDVDTFGWTSIGTAWNTENDSFEMIGNGIQALVQLEQVTDIPFKDRKKIYVQVELEVKNDDVSSVGLVAYGSNGTGGVKIVNTNEFEKDKPFIHKAIIELGEGGGGYVKFQVRNTYPNSQANIDKKVIVKNPLLIDLTETFGEGNEPDLFKMDKFMGYVGFFDGFLTNNKLSDSHFKMYMSDENISGGVKFPILVLAFDDGFETDYSKVFQMFKEKGIRGTSFINGGHINGGEGRTRRLSVPQMKELLINGWDIQCHYFTHPRLSELNEQEIREQLEANNQFFIDNDLPLPEHSAYPYGDYSIEARDISKDYRKTLRRINSATGLPYNTYEGIDFYNLNARGTDIREDNIERLQERKEDIDSTVENNGILIFFSHEFSETAGDYETNPDYYEELIDYAISKGMRIMTMKEMYNFLKLMGYVNE